MTDGDEPFFGTKGVVNAVAKQQKKYGTPPNRVNSKATKKFKMDNRLTWYGA
jgi:hypothetical protein